VLFAHQGGWDEALFVIVPLGAFAWLLKVAKRRAERESSDALAGVGDPVPDDPVSDAGDPARRAGDPTPGAGEP
jgi:hypothetical protein